MELRDLSGKMVGKFVTEVSSGISLMELRWRGTIFSTTADLVVYINMMCADKQVSSITNFADMAFARSLVPRS